MSAEDTVSTVWLVREAIRKEIAIGEGFDIAQLDRLLKKGAAMTKDAVSTAVYEVYRSDPGCLAVIGKEGRRHLYRKIGDPRVLPQRKRRNAVTPRPAPVQQDMPLLPPSPPPSVDMTVVHTHALALFAALGIPAARLPDVSTIPTAELQAELARRWAKP